MKKKLLVLVMIVALIATFALAACNPFRNPGDYLGGGGTGEVADPADSSTSTAAKDEIKSKSDLTDLSANTTGSGATTVKETTDVVKISSSGTYVFSGRYGGISIANDKLQLHFIFDGATVSNANGVAIDGTGAKKTSLIITVKAGTTNNVTNGGDDVNAIHVKGSLSINGTGTLNVTSNSKNAVKASGEIKVVDATVNLTAANHAIAGATLIAANCTINVKSAGKDGINVECNGAQQFTTDDGFVSLTNVKYTCNVKGDGIQANTVVYINGGEYNVTTSGEFVTDTAQNRELYGLTASDFRYTKSGSTYQKVDTDRSRGTYAIAQSCKGIKVSEIEYTDDNDNTVVVTDGDYCIVIDSGDFTINSTDDAIHGNSGDVIINGGSFNLSTLDDAITSDSLTKITGGNVNITSCYEGLEGAYVEISGGTINIVASDDGINAASNDRSVTPHIIISGGDVTVNASGDGIDSNGSILISGGTVVVHGPTSGGDAGLDADKGIVVTGGILFASSTLGMVETPSTNSTQCVVSYAQNSAISVGSVISLRDSNGKVLLEVTVLKSNCQSIILSHPDLNKGSTYSIYSGNSQIQSFTISSIITTIGSSSQGGPGSRPGGPGGRF